MEVLTRNNQFDWIIQQINRHNLQYWLDSGSLLGMVREQNLLVHDNDIDISILEEHETKLLRLVEDMKKAGFRLVKYSYKGFLFKCKLKDSLNRNLRDIDINIFEKWNDVFWCPQDGPMKGLKIRRFKLTPRRVLNKVLVEYSNRMASSKSFSRFPWSLYSLKTWWIPVDLVQPTIEYGEFGVSIPKNYEAYLQYRYGNWRIPNRNWSFWNDDGGLNKARPEELVDLPTKRRSKR